MTPDQKELLRLAEERKALDEAILSHFRLWSMAEFSLTNLLISLLGIPPSRNYLAMVVYYTPTSLDARLAMVDNTVVHFIEAVPWEDKSIPERFTPLWAKVKKHMDKA